MACEDCPYKEEIIELRTGYSNLNVSVAEIKRDIEYTHNDVIELKGMVSAINQKPAKDWEMLKGAIFALLGGAVLYLIQHFVK